MQVNVNTWLREKAIVEGMASNAQLANVDIWGIKRAKLMGCKTACIGMAKGRTWWEESKNKKQQINMVLQQKYSDKLREQKMTVNVKDIEKKISERRRGTKRENQRKYREKTSEKQKQYQRKYRVLHQKYNNKHTEKDIEEKIVTEGQK